MKIVADFELWARFWQHAELFSAYAPLSGFRSHSNQKTASHLKEYEKEAVDLLRKYGDNRAEE